MCLSLGKDYLSASSDLQEVLQLDPNVREAEQELEAVTGLLRQSLMENTANAQRVKHVCMCHLRLNMCWIKTKDLTSLLPSSRSDVCLWSSLRQRNETSVDTLLSVLWTERNLKPSAVRMA